MMMIRMIIRDREANNENGEENEKKMARMMITMIIRDPIIRLT